MGNAKPMPHPKLLCFEGGDCCCDLICFRGIILTTVLLVGVTLLIKHHRTHRFGHSFSLFFHRPIVIKILQLPKKPPSSLFSLFQIFLSNTEAAQELLPCLEKP